MSRALSTVRYASRTTGVNFEKLLTWGAIGVGLYLALKTLSFVKGAAGVLTSSGEAIGSGLYDFFHRDPLGETVYYTVKFPDGSKHSIPSKSVNNSGVFKNSGNGVNYAGDGRDYQIVINKATGEKVAVSL